MIDYALVHWPALELYLGGGCVELDNNLMDNASCPTAVGKRTSSSLAKSAPAGQRGAIIYTISKAVAQEDCPDDDGDDAGINQDAAKHRTITVERARSLLMRINIECDDVDRGRPTCALGVGAFEVTR